MSLDERIDAIAAGIVAREARHADDLSRARAKADELHAVVAAAIDRFNAAIADAAPGLRVDVLPPRLDEKHAHCVQFDLARGRHRGLVIVKSKAEVILVGPFKTGKNEGPCRTFPFSAADELNDALGDFLERFLEEATNP